MTEQQVIIAEKPNAAKKIAQSLSSSPKKKSGKGNTYWFEFEKDGKDIVVVPAVGHLYTLSSDEDGWDYPTFEYKWEPTFEANEDSAFAKKYYRNIKKFVDEADEVIVATDYDIEGEVIGYNILKFIFEEEDAKRMKFSTLTKDELIESYENPDDGMDKNLVESGLARHVLDFLYGVNTSRALTHSVKNSDNEKVNFHLLSAGRVQAPMLEFLKKREKEIQEFEPDPYWELELLLEVDGNEVPAEHVEDRFWEEEDVQEARDNSEGKDAIVKDISKRKYKKKPPKPFHLTSLQSAAYSSFGYSPKKTLNIAQNLYERGAISYPRTSSQKLPKSIGYKTILNALKKKNKDYKKIVKELLSMKKLKPRQGKKKDQAHPAIYPTPEPPKKLNKEEKNIYDLIVRRFFAVFGKPATRKTLKLTLECGGEEYKAKGRRTLKKGWIRYYEKYANFDEVILPEVEEGDELKQKDIIIHDKETQPPNRYSQGSIVKEMEKNGLGTKATRSNILDKLYDRDYIKNRSIEVTNLGMTIADTLEEHVPEIVSEDLTREFEEKMEQIEQGEKSREEIIQDAEKLLENVMGEFQENEKDIGERIAEAVAETRESKWIVGTCPKCEENNLRIIKSKRSGKRFIGCEGYRDDECSNSFPLPQSGLIKTTDKICKHCDHPKVLVIRKGKKPWSLCINDECPQKEEWKKEKEKKKKRKGIKAISGIGKKTAVKLVKAGYKTPEELASADPKDLQEIDGIGPSTAEKYIEKAKG